MEIFVGKNDEQYGPFPIDKVNESIANGEFSLEKVGSFSLVYVNFSTMETHFVNISIF